MFTEDLAEFVDPDDFAVEARYNNAATVFVNFDQAYLQQLGLAGTNPAALGIATDFPAAGAPVGKSLAIAGVTYTITDRQPQDDGAFVVLQLQAA